MTNQQIAWDNIAETIGHDLYFYVAGVGKIPLDKNSIVSKGFLGFLATGLYSRFQFILTQNNSHTLTTATSRRL